MTMSITLKRNDVWESLAAICLLIAPILLVIPFIVSGILSDFQLAYYVIYSVYIVGSLLIMKYSKHEWSEFGLSRTNLSDSLSLSLGFVVAFIITQTIHLELHLSTELGPIVVIQELVFCFAFSGPAQELLFRGVLFFSLLRWRDWKTALVVSSFLFGLVHILKGVHYVIATILIGFFYGYITYRTRNIIGPIVAHSFNNFILGFILVP
jgi:membrane protease YdiL (CAAX protease family)